MQKPFIGVMRTRIAGNQFKIQFWKSIQDGNQILEFNCQFLMLELEIHEQQSDLVFFDFTHNSTKSAAISSGVFKFTHESRVIVLIGR